jgi:hypothetical protein
MTLKFQMFDWQHVRTGTFKFPLDRSLEIVLPHFIELEDGGKKEIIFTRAKATARNMEVGFKIKGVESE